MSQETINQLILLFLYLIIGFVCNKINILTATACSKLCSFLFVVLLPATALYSAVSQNDYDQDIFIKMAMAAVILYLITPIVTFVICRIFKMEKTYQLMLNYSNVGYMGIPIVGSFFGTAYIFYEMVVMTIFNIHVFSVGTLMLTKNSVGWKVMVKKLCTPVIFASVIAFFLAAYNVKFPSLPTSLLGSLNNLTTPLAMIVVGAQLGQSDLLRSFTNPKLYIMTAFRLVVYPIATFYIARAFLGVNIITEILTIVSGLPVAGIVSMMSIEHNGNKELAAQSVCITTIMSMATLPILLTLLPPLT